MNEVNDPRASGADHPLFAIVADPSTVADIPASSRKAEMSRVFEAIIERIPADRRAEARRDLEEPRIATPVAASDPESARLWSRLMSLRLADARDEAPGAGGPQAPPSTVRVALVSSGLDASARAVVVRRPDDGGVPLVLVPSDRPSGEALLRGLQAAERTLRTYKPTPGKSTIITVKFGAARKEPTAAQRQRFERWDAAIAALRKQPEVELAHVGRARATMMLAPDRTRARPREP